MNCINVNTLICLSHYTLNRLTTDFVIHKQDCMNANLLSRDYLAMNMKISFS